MRTETAGDRVRRAREALGLTQEELGRRAGVPRSTIANLEAGKPDSRGGTLAPLARALQTTVEALRGESPYPAGRSAQLLLRELAETLPEEIAYLDLPLAGVANSTPSADLPPDDLILSAPRAAAGRYRRYRIAGDCMEPEIPDGAEVLVNVERQPQLGEPVLVQIGDAVLCKALTARNGAWVLRCMRGDEREVRLRPGEEMTYVGVVEYILARPRRYSTTNTRGRTLHRTASKGGIRPFPYGILPSRGAPGCRAPAACGCAWSGCTGGPGRALRAT